MATALENLTTARDNMAKVLAEVTANPKPSYSVNGQSFSWTEYQRFLLDGIDKLNSQIANMSDPVEIVSRGF